MITLAQLNQNNTVTITIDNLTVTLTEKDILELIHSKIPSPISDQPTRLTPPNYAHYPYRREEPISNPGMQQNFRQGQGCPSLYPSQQPFVFNTMYDMINESRPYGKQQQPNGNEWSSRRFTENVDANKPMGRIAMIETIPYRYPISATLMGELVKIPTLMENDEVKRIDIGVKGVVRGNVVKLYIIEVGNGEWGLFHKGTYLGINSDSAMGGVTKDHVVEQVLSALSFLERGGPGLEIIVSAEYFTEEKGEIVKPWNADENTASESIWSTLYFQLTRLKILTELHIGVEFPFSIFMFEKNETIHCIISKNEDKELFLKVVNNETGREEVYSVRMMDNTLDAYKSLIHTAIISNRIDSKQHTGIQIEDSKINEAIDKAKELSLKEESVEDKIEEVEKPTVFEKIKPSVKTKDVKIHRDDMLAMRLWDEIRNSYDTDLDFFGLEGTVKAALVKTAVSFIKRNGEDVNYETCELSRPLGDFKRTITFKELNLTPRKVKLVVDIPEEFVQDVRTLWNRIIKDHPEVGPFSIQSNAIKAFIIGSVKRGIRRHGKLRGVDFGNMTSGAKKNKNIRKLLGLR